MDNQFDFNSPSEPKEELTLSEKPKKRFSKKKGLAIIAFALVVAIFSGCVTWVTYLKNNPLVELAIASANTLSSSASATVTAGREKADRDTPKYEACFVNEDGPLQFSYLGSDGSAYYRDGDFVFLKESDGEVDIRRLERDEENAGRLARALKKGDFAEVARYLNEAIFERELFNPEEAEKWLFSSLEHYGSREFLEEKLGFSVKKEKGIKTFSFKFSYKEITFVAYELLYSARDVFADETVYDELLSLMRIAANLNFDYEISIEIQVKNNRLVAVNAVADGDKACYVFDAELYDFGDSAHDARVVEEFLKYKEILGDYKRYKLSHDGSYTFTDMNGEKYNYLG